MPILDVEVVCPSQAEPADISTQALADALGSVLGTGPGRTWVRLRRLSSDGYAENAAPVETGSLPVFVTVLHARPPEGEQRKVEVLALTSADAECLARPSDYVHVSYAAAAAGRQAFGGRLVE